jgi:hypothetical protein
MIRLLRIFKQEWFRLPLSAVLRHFGGFSSGHVSFVQVTMLKTSLRETSMT